MTHGWDSSGSARALSSEPGVGPSAKRVPDQHPVFLITSIARLVVHRGEKRGRIPSTSRFVGCTPRDRRHAPGGGGGWHRGQKRAHGIGFLSAQRAPACGGVTPQVTVGITSWLLCETNSSAVRVEKGSRAMAGCSGAQRVRPKYGDNNRAPHRCPAAVTRCSTRTEATALPLQNTVRLRTGRAQSSVRKKSQEMGWLA